MLQVSGEAAVLIAQLVAQRSAPEAGLRIAQRTDHAALAMSLADGPDPNDAVLVEHDVRVFLAPVAQARLADCVLDAHSGRSGSAFFVRGGADGIGRGSAAPW